jgi:hypothetical protein
MMFLDRLKGAICGVQEAGIAAALLLAKRTLGEARVALQLRVAQFFGAKHVSLECEHFPAERVVPRLGDRNAAEGADLLTTYFLPGLVDKEQHDADTPLSPPSQVPYRNYSFSITGRGGAKSG